MSIVTNIILVCSSSENADKVIADFSGYKYKNNSFNIVSIHDANLPKQWYGGTKYLETNIFIGAYNHLDLTSLIDYCKSIKWEDPESVQLIVKEQEDSRFRIINLFE